MIKRTKILLAYISFLLVIFLPEIRASGNQLKFQSITTEQGLNSNWVNSITRDKTGFIWIATKYGLNRYDGVRMYSYKHNPKDSTSIPSNYINKLFTDNQNNVWVGTLNKGLCIYNPQINGFKNLSSSLHTNIPIHIHKIIQHTNNEIWISTGNDGVYIYNLNDKKFRKAYGAKYNQAAYGLVENANGLVYVANASDTLFVCHPQLGVVDEIIIDPLQKNNKGVKQEKILLFDTDSSLWIGTNGVGAFLLKKDNQTFKEIKGLSNPIIKDMIQRGDEVLLATDNGGLNAYNLKNETIEVIKSNFLDKFSLASNGLYDLFLDEEDILWVSTFDGGMSFHNPKNHQFNYYYPTSHNKKGLKHQHISAIQQAKGNKVYVGTEGGGLHIFNPICSSFEPVEQVENSNVFNDNYILGVQLIGDNLYASSFRKGVEVINVHTMKKPIKILKKEFINNVSIVKFQEASKGIIYMMSQNGYLYKYYENDDAYEVLNPNKKWKNTTKQFVVRSLFKDSKGKIWIGSGGGKLKVFDEEKKEFYDIPLQINNQHIKFPLLFIEEGKNNNLWIATGGGLLKYNQKTKECVLFDMEYGLPTNLLFDILKDGEDKLWISSNYGLISFNTQTYDFETYNSKDGLQGRQYSSTASLKSNDGYYYFGGVNGLNKFKPQEIKKDTFCGKLVLTNLKILKRSKNKDKRESVNNSIPSLKKIELVKDDYIFSLEFLLINYTNPEKVKYNYKLEGFDKQWITTDNSGRLVTYTNIPGGKYKFRVRACNHGGVLCKEELSIEVIVIPPVYKRTWFIIILTIIFVTGLYLFNKFRIKYLQRQNIWLEKEVIGRTKKIDNQRLELKEKNIELEEHRYNLEELIIKRTKDLQKAKEKAEESDRLKSSFLTNMSHEIRTPMNAIVGFGKLLRSDDLKKEEKERYLNIINESSETLLRLIDDIIDISKIEAGQLKIKNEDVEFNDFITEIYIEYREKIERITKKNIQLYLSVPNTIIVVEIDKTRIKQIIVNLLENAIKFTERGQITLKLKIKSNEVEVSVEDTGIGISKKNQKIIFERFTKIENSAGTLYAGTGLGLFVSKRIIEMYRGKIGVESQENMGSIFWFTIPW